MTDMMAAACATPRFSIVLPCLNAAGTLPATLRSLRAQTRADWEAICVDDGSSDATRSVIRQHARRDPRIRLVRNTGKGPSDARNEGALVHARSGIIAFCDADDLWMPDKLRRLAEAFGDPALDACFGRVAFFDRDPTRPRSRSGLPEGPLSVPLLMGENPVCTMSNLAVRADAFRRSGGFDRRLVHNEDLEWLIRVVAAGGVVRGVDAVLVAYRTSPGGLSANVGAMRAGRAAALATAARHGFRPDRRAEAIHLRYLARRVLRAGPGGLSALRLCVEGLATSPAGFFSDPRRGALTLIGAAAAPLLPGRLRRTLFAS